jgi:predicted nucleic acid-binding protein
MSRKKAAESSAIYRMPQVLVDSCVLIDIIDGDPRWAEWSVAQLAPVVLQQRAIINPIIYAELAAAFTTIEALEQALSPLGLKREQLPWEAAFLAGQAHKQYRKRGGAKRSPLPDFYIGAHAAIAGHTLLTRDAERYRAYYPRLSVIAPE